MEERSVKILALACSLAGIAVIYFSSAAADQSALPTDVKNINIDDVGISAKACGNVTACKTTNGHVFLQITDATGTLRAVAFNTTASRINVNCSLMNMGVCVLGKIQEYPQGSGDMEIVVEKVMW